MSKVDWGNAPEFREPTAFERVFEGFWRDMEDCHSQRIGASDGDGVYAVTVELGYLANWLDRLHEAYEKEKRL